MAEWEKDSAFLRGIPFAPARSCDRSACIDDLNQSSTSLYA